MTPLEELEAKLARVRALLERRGRENLLLASPAGLSWLSGGGRGIAGFLVTRDALHMLLHADWVEVDGDLFQDNVFTDKGRPWWRVGNPQAQAVEIVPPEKLLADIPVDGAQRLSPAEELGLRAPLFPAEVARYHRLGEMVGIALTHAMLHCRPGLTEYQLGGLVAGPLIDSGVEVVRLRVAVDNRAFHRPDPFPSEARLEQYAVVGVTARQHGLHVSATRSVHFDPPSPDLLARHHRCIEVDAALIAATRPNLRLVDLFEVAKAAYTSAGAPEAWQRCSFGGATGYAFIDERAGPETIGSVAAPQAFAWSPTLASVRSEDTMLVTETSHEILTRTPDLPTLSIDTPAGPIERPAIVVR